jgi:hypothetical protein
VHQEAQRRGIGSLLMEHLLRWLDERGTPMTLLDATDAGAGLYARFGFVENDHACLFQLLDHPGKKGDPSGAAAGTVPEITRSIAPGIRPLLPGDLPDLLAFDTSVFGAGRCRVIQALLADFPGRAFCRRNGGGKISGFVLAQDRQIGPWVAREEESAEALLRAALTLPFEGPPQVVVPGMNPAGMELLDRLGFRLMRSTRHMRRGGEGLITRRDLVYGQTSFAIG